MDTSFVTSLGDFLRWGPLGLAGIMLVLVIFALTLGKVTAARERILRTFMYIGAVCFLAALAAQFFERSGEFRVTLSVIPSDLDGSPFDPPRVVFNSQDQDGGRELKVVRDSTLSIDLSRAFDLFEDQRVIAENAQAEAEQFENELVRAEEQVNVFAAREQEARSALIDLQSNLSSGDFELREARETIAFQSRALEEARAQTQALKTRIDALSGSQNPSENGLRALDDAVESINRALTLP